MSRSELNRRLVKLAANELNYAIQGSMNNPAVGKTIGTHFQYLGAVDPNSPEGQAYIQKHGIPKSTADFYYQQGKSMRDYARTDWRSVSNAVGGNTFNPNQLMQLGPVADFKNRAVQGFSPESKLTLARRNPSTSHYFDQDGNIITDNTYVNMGGNAAGYLYLKPQFDRAESEIADSMMQGMGQSFDRNSPFVRGLIADAGTGYLRSKIDEWAPRNSTMGQAFNSFGNLALGLASMVPGYESAMNWLADWQYGDQFKQLQNTLNPPAQPPAPAAQPPAQLPAPAAQPPAAAAQDPNKKTP